MNIDNVSTYVHSKPEIVILFKRSPDMIDNIFLFISCVHFELRQWQNPRGTNLTTGLSINNKYWTNEKVNKTLLDCTSQMQQK